MKKLTNIISTNIHINTIFHLLLILLIYFFCRIIFFIFNYRYFAGIDFFNFIKILLAGIRYDLAAVCMLNLPFVFFRTIPFNFRFNKYYQKIIMILFFIVNGIAILFNCIDIAYFDFTLKRTTADIFYTQGLGYDIIHLLPNFIIDFWYITLIFLVFIFLILYIKRFFKSNFYKFSTDFISIFTQLLIFIVSITVMFILARGGTQLRPLNIMSAGKYTEARNIPLVLNTPFTILNTLGKDAIAPYDFFENKEELDTLFNPIKINENTKKINNKNIVIIILESFSSEHIGYFNKTIYKKSFTPFLDSLMEHSIVFANAYANGKKSNEGIAAILASIPSLMDIPYTSSIYAGNNIAGIATLLDKKNYNSSFFHGGNNGTMGFDNFTRTAGFEKYYGRKEYPGDDYDGKWGIWDEEYLQYFADMIDKMQQPFITSVFTLSSHHPFKIPEKYKDKFPQGPLPIHKTIAYTDYSLKKFFQKISSKKWFNNTIFLLTADHTSESYIPYYSTKIGIYKIPIVIYQKNIKPQVYNNVVQQIDIMPTLLNMINYNENYYSLGTNALDTTDNHFAINYINNTFQFIQKDYTLIFDGEKTINLFNYKQDSLLHNDIKNIYPKITADMEKRLKAFLQVFSKDLRTNNMIYK